MTQRQNELENILLHSWIFLSFCPLHLEMCCTIQIERELKESMRHSIEQKPVLHVAWGHKSQEEIAKQKILIILALYTAVNVSQSCSLSPNLRLLTVLPNLDQLWKKYIVSYIYNLKFSSSYILKVKRGEINLITYNNLLL